MNKEENLEKVLNTIQLDEGDSFEYNKNAILNAYKKQDENQSSIVIKILTVFGGIIASLAFLGFLLLTGIYDSEMGVLILGIVAILASLLMDKAFDRIILDTISVSSFVMGFLLVIVWFNMQEIDEHTVIGLAIVIAFSSLFISQNYMLAFISVLIIQTSLMYFVFIENTYFLYQIFIAFNTVLLTCWVLYESKIIIANQKLLKLYNPVRIGLVISLLVALTPYLTREMTSFFEQGNESTLTQSIWLTSTIIILSILFLVYKIIDILIIEDIKKKTIIYGLSIMILLASAYSPSILGAILVILLCFYVNYKTGLVFGIVSLIYFVSRYYYDLNFTLLIKSMLLFSSGIICIAFYLYMNHKPQANEKV